MDKVATLEGLLAQEYGVRTHQGPGSGTVVVGTSSTRILGLNPNRVGLVFTNNGSIDVYLKPYDAAVVDDGILLGAGGGVLALDWKTDFDLVSANWQGIVASATQDVFVSERVAY